MGLQNLKAFAALLGMVAGVSGCATGPKFSPREVAPGIFEGRLPATPQDFQALRRAGVRTILSLETMPYHIGPERQLAAQSGIAFRNVPILPSMIPPRPERVREALLVLSDPSLQPVFVHCLTGDDRTSFLVGLYRMYFQDWSAEAAWREMVRSGFHARWWLWGLEAYFWRHTRAPEWAILKAAAGRSVSARAAGGG